MAITIKRREANAQFNTTLPGSLVKELAELRRISDKVGADFTSSFHQALWRFAREYRAGLEEFRLPANATPSQARDVRHRELLRTNGLDSLKPPAIDNGTSEKN